MLEYEFYYFKHFYELNKDNLYKVRPEGENNYIGIYLRSIFSIICIISAILSIYSSILEFKLKKKLGFFFEGK